MVSMIEPSMGDVSERPYIRNTLRKTPINMAAPKNLRMSARSIRSARSHRSGTSEMRAVAINDASANAKGRI